MHGALRDLPTSAGRRTGPGPGPLRVGRKLLAFSGPAYLVAVGYVDPGNWATDIAAGSAFGYSLLSVVLLSSVMAFVLQTLAARLGIATGQDLAQACRQNLPRAANAGLWLLAEIGICACDLAELLGAALGLKLLFGVPLLAGVVLTTFDVLLILALQKSGFRKLEAVVIALLAIVAGCFLVQLGLAGVDPAQMARGFAPKAALITDPRQLYLAAGILGATIMPHNLYLHGALVQDRSPAGAAETKRARARWATVDSAIALGLAMMLNAAILVLAAATFHQRGLSSVGDISEAHRLIAPLLGAGAAGLFALALLAAGQNASITATLAGQVVMEGFLRWRLSLTARRTITRLVALVPAVAVIGIYGEQGLGRLLILSQVVLSLQLPFAVVPLVAFTGRRRLMGDLVSPGWLKATAWTIAACIIALNLALVLGWLFGSRAS